MPIHVTVQEHVAEITLDRPEVLNALDPDHLRALQTAFARARDDTSIRVVVLTGAGTRAFCVGSDLKKTPPGDHAFVASYFGRDEEARRALYIRDFDISRQGMWKPVIAAVNGHCVGGGLELALQCDLRVAAAGATFGLPEPKVGSIPAVGGIPSLLRMVPSAVAMRMLFTGDSIDAAEALRIGLVSDVWEPADLMPRTREMARRIASNAPLAIQMIKKLAFDGAALPIDRAIGLSEVGWGLLRDTDDRIEGRKAFSEKRKPLFHGR